jgi:ketosteroid isomerase-like protein
VNKPLVDFDSNGCVEMLNHDLAGLEDEIKLHDTPILVYENLVFKPAEELLVEAAKATAFVESWRSAWSGKKQDFYESMYDQDFRNSDGRSRRDWMEHKRQVASNYDRIEIELEDLRIYRHRDVVVASFRQNYVGGGRFTSQGLKRLYLRESDGRFLIAGEDFEPLPSPPEKWLTAEEKRAALTTPPLTAAQVSEPAAIAAAGAIMPSGSDVTIASLARTFDSSDDAQAAADETARAAIESLSAGDGAVTLSARNDDPPDASEPSGLEESQIAADQGASDQASTEPVRIVSVVEPATVEIAVVEPPEPVESVEPAESGEADARWLLDGWLAAWSARDEDAYFAFYAPDFRFLDRGMGLEAFRKYRGRIMRRAESIEVSADDVKVRMSGDAAEVVFEQTYRSDSVSDRGRKTLALVRLDGIWRIVSEAFEASS